MPSTPVVNERKTKDGETRASPPHGISVGWGVVLMVAAAAAWILVLVGFHNITARLLS
jgi:hypothetical protein